MTERDVYNLLAARYSSEAGWAIIPQVRSQTGAPSRQTIRTADALAMQLYPSRGCTLHGFEIKVRRSDWRKELENAEKAEAVARYCHQWSVVAPKGIIPPDEVPPGWGHIEAHKDKLHTRKAAPMREPEPLPYEFLASIFRNIARRHEKATRKELEEAFQRGARHSKAMLEHETRQHDALKQVVQAFEDASGITISRYSTVDANRDLGVAVRAVLNGDRELNAHRTRLKLLHDQAKRVYDLVAEELEELVEVRP